MKTDKITGLNSTTKIIRNSNTISVYYHDTEVFRYYPLEDRFILNTGGFLTVMTAIKMKQALNEYINSTKNLNFSVSYKPSIHEMFLIKDKEEVKFEKTIEVKI